MEGPRVPKADEFPKLVEFLDSALRSDVGWSVTDEYPTALNERNLHNFRIIKEEEKILSHAVIRPTIVKTRRGLFKIGCIGSVVTHQDYRNQGLSHSVMNECLSAVTQQGCDLALLWTNLHDFYRKFGFELSGSEISLILDASFNPPNPQQTYKIIEGNRVDPQALLRVYMQHTVSSIRTIEEINKYLKIPNSRIYTSWDNTGKMVAYAVEGKGIDLNGYVHEWGGQLDALLDLFKHIQRTQARAITVISPAHSQNLIRSALESGAKRVDGFLGMMKITNPSTLFSKVIRNAKQEFGFEDFFIEKRGPEFYFGKGAEVFKTTSEADIIRLIFGPQKPSQLHDYGPTLNKVLDQMFPYELWVWGWESV